tara:strand:+ start:204220 stop:208062 length:3843 start_codon:yes stop_codon:yes gene_type:complete
MKYYTIIYTVIFNMVFPQNLVNWEPEQPVPGDMMTIHYNHIEGSLPDNTNQVYIHLGFNGWQETSNHEMDYAPDLGNGWWRYEYEIPEDTDIIDFVFTDMDGNWDNNGGMGIDWHINLNYSWVPFNPNPGDDITIYLENVNQGGEIGWTVDSGDGQELPIEMYWGESSYIENGMIFTPLVNQDNSIYTANLGPFLSGEQVVYSVKFGIRWEDGTWDSNAAGQILYYDIYMDYSIDSEDPYIFFVSPTPENGEEVQPPIEFTVIGAASNVDFWINGELIGSDDSSPFEIIWDPGVNQFGSTTITVIATNDAGGVSYLFRELYLIPNVMIEPVPEEVKDGVTVVGNTVSISLYAPYKSFVAVKGNWNSQFTDGELMKLSGDTLWWYQTDLPNGNYSYQFNLEGEKLIGDPWSKDVTWLDPSGQWESGDYNHAKTIFSIGSTEFDWTDQNFIRPEQKDLIIYELHIGDFNGDAVNTGKFQDVTNKIEEGYFNDLGINTIELMPVNECEGDWSWGYNPSFYMAPESSYGTPNELKQLVNTAHENGIAVLFDVVFNHLWGSSPLFQLYHPIDNWNYEDHNYDHCPYFHNEESPWGYKLQHWHEVDGRDYRAWKHVRDVLLTYVNDYHADGFRFDVTAGIGWGGNENGSSFYANLLDDIDPSFILVAEEDNPYQVNNSDFDSGWDYSYHHSFFNNLMGYASNMWDLQNHLQWWTQGWPEHTQPCNYMVSHDETRLIYEGVNYVGMSLEEAYKKSKLGAAALFTGTGTPMMYHGQEFGQSSPVSLDPQPLQWDNLSTPEGEDLNDYFKNIIWLRNNWEVIRGANLEIIYLNNTQKIIGMKRHDESLGQTVYSVMNFNNFEQTISNLPFPYAGVWYEFIEDTQLETDSGTFSNYLIPGSSARIFTNYSNWSNVGETEINVDVFSGWNIVGLPMEVQDMGVESVYPDAVEGTLYSFDATYFLTDNLNYGNGYWLYFNDQNFQTVTGTSLETLSIEISEGWNLISGISEATSVSSISDPSEIIIAGTIYGFNGTYVNAIVLEPGEGYWINANSSGEITIESGRINEKIISPVASIIKGNKLKIFLSENKEVFQELIFGTRISDRETQSFSLPPTPPLYYDKSIENFLDVRFFNDSKHCEEIGEFTILSNTEFVDVKYEMSEDETWVLIDESGDEILLKRTGNIEIKGGESPYRLEKLTNDYYPNELFLHPAYPNPFNPVTTISFELPSERKVFLVIYDVRGNEIKEMVRGNLKKGIHKIAWDAAGVSAGIYLAHLSTEDFFMTNKLILLK